jgi:hypothetical protein
MNRNAATTDRLRNLLSKIESLTEAGELHWERQIGSAHRFARWNNNLLILGPAAPLDETSVPRYVMITPFDSPDCIELNSDDPELGIEVTRLVQDVENASRNQDPVDPFAITDEILQRLT